MKTKFLIFIGIFILISCSPGCGGREKQELEDYRNVDPIEVFTSNSKGDRRNMPYVDIKDTCMIRFYYPKYSRIDLVCGEMPKKDEDSVIMVCAGAYTSKCLNYFVHSNIDGNHVSGGKFFYGESKNSYRGAFSFYEGKPHFAYDDWNNDFQMAALKGGCGFAQDMMIHNGGIVRHNREKESTTLFRSLCLVGGKLAIADSKEVIPFGDFIQNLINAGATEAIYLDMGEWKYSWYRDESGKPIDIHPNPTQYGTNWVTFYK